jgi:hypothetical protein
MLPNPPMNLAVPPQGHGSKIGGPIRAAARSLAARRSDRDSMNFRCTKKAQVRLRLTPSGLAPVPDTVSAVDWHCNVVTLGRRPFFLFAHSQSLYAFFVTAAGNSPLDAFGRAFRDQLAAALVREGVAASLGARLMDDGPDTICRAIDRRVLGTMNDHVNMSRFFVEDAGGLDDRVLAKIHDAINDSPMSILGMESPRRVLHALFSRRGAA